MLCCSSRTAARGRGPAGFTLIELLIVVAIISMLMSISLPGLSRAREQAAGVVCSATMRDITTMVIGYQNEEEGRLPPIESQLDTGRWHSWAETLYARANMASDYELGLMKAHNFPVLTNRNGEFKIYTCKTADPLDSNTGSYRIYAPGYRRDARLNIPYLVDAVCHDFSDVQAYGRTSPAIQPFPQSGAAPPWVGRLSDDAVIGIAERHYGGANYAYLNGSVSRSRDLREQLAKDWDMDGRPNLP